MFAWNRKILSPAYHDIVCHKSGLIQFLAGMHHGIMVCHTLLRRINHMAQATKQFHCQPSLSLIKIIITRTHSQTIDLPDGR